ncbi:MAG: ABC transporter substrate-binding protein [Burkholderiales bacterium]
MRQPHRRAPLLHRFGMCLAGLAAAWAGLAAQGAEAQQRIAIGLVSPLSGPLSGVGNEVSLGTRAYFDALNRSGGVGGRPIEIVAMDDGNEPERSTQAVNEIVAKHSPVAFANCFGTVGCVAQATALKQTGIPMVGPIAGAQVLRTPEQRHVFAVRPSADSEVRALAEQLSGYGVQDAVVVYQDDGFGRAYLPTAQALLPKMNIRVAETVQLNPASPDYDAAAKRIQLNKGHTVLLLANVTHSAGVLKAVSAIGVEPFVMNLAAQANAGFIKNMTGIWSYSVFATFTPSPWKRQLATVREYQDAWMRVANNQSFSYLGFEAYLNARVLGEALQRAERRLTPERVVAALESMPALNFDGLTVKFTADKRQGADFVDIAVLSNRGRFVQQ